ncbi:MAG: adenylyltransferase/cytidyltransferase family protein [Clostridia bacterium]|nr:adenylyltransferase/cytidyltransferase family protein [Clostridia bacterium]
MKQYKIGYTQGVYDMFHIGHLNLINHAKEYCDYLIVGVNADALVETYKHKTPVISERERQLIVANLKAVDQCVIAHTLDKVAAWKELRFDAVFIGDDWKGNPRWEQTKIDLAAYGVDVVFLPHTEGVSSTMLRPENEHRVKE